MAKTKSSFQASTKSSKKGKYIPGVTLWTEDKNLMLKAHIASYSMDEAKAEVGMKKWGESASDKVFNGEFSGVACYQQWKKMILKDAVAATLHARMRRFRYQAIEFTVDSTEEKLVRKVKEAMRELKLVQKAALDLLEAQDNLPNPPSTTSTPDPIPAVTTPSIAPSPAPIIGDEETPDEIGGVAETETAETEVVKVEPETETDTEIDTEELNLVIIAPEPNMFNRVIRFIERVTLEHKPTSIEVVKEKDGMSLDIKF